MDALKPVLPFLIGLWSVGTLAQPSLDDERLQRLHALDNVEQSALEAYFGERNDQAITSLKQLIALLDKELATTKSGEPMNLALKYDLLLAHGRLAVVYGRREEAAERAKSLNRAFEYGKESMSPPLRSIDEVLPLVASVDKNYTKH